MSLKMIAMDMDGTLLDGKKNVAPEDCAAVKKAIAAGFYVTLATGRMYRSAQPYAKKLGITHPLVTYNGALIKDPVTGKELGQFPLAKDIAQRVIALCRRNGVYVQAYVHDTLWCYEDCEEVRYYAKLSRVPYEVKGDAMLQLPDDPHKLLVMTDRVGEWRTKLLAAFPEKVKIVSSAKGFLEITAPGTNKWRALQLLARQENIKDEEILCMGDSDNDLEMIRHCGLGVAMGNADTAVREASKVVTATNENHGVSLLLNQILTKQIQVPED